MSNYKGTDDIFPLKGRVRGDLQISREVIEANLSQIYNDMITLREKFGVKIYDRYGNKLFLELWRVGKQQSNTAPQLRWKFTVGEAKKKINITVSLYETITCKKNNYEKFIQIIESVSHLPVYKEIIDTDIQRVQLNVRNKSSLKLLQNINEIDQNFMLEATLNDYVKPVPKIGDLLLS